MNPEEAAGHLKELLEDTQTVIYKDYGSSDRVKRQADMMLRQIFGRDAKYITDLDEIRFSSVYDDSKTLWDEAKERIVNLLSTAIDELTLFGNRPDAPGQPQLFGRRVFVVHGHDDALKQTTARLLEQLDLDAIILHEQPNKGRTIIEKFEDYSDVPFAVVLLTPDDIAYPREADPKEGRPRARQNVVLELGFFLGRLGRKRVAALHKGNEGFELPSDYSGVVFIPVDDAGKWQFDLVRELKASGIEVDANLIVGA